jgi:hypothetical protein
MSLTVTNNPDGTITVSCDGASVTVGKPPTSSGGPRFHPVTDAGTGVVAHIVPDRSVSPVSDFSWSGIDQIVTSYKLAADQRLHGHASGDVMKVGVRRADKIDLHALNEQIRASQATSGLGLEIYFVQRDD